MTPHQAFLADIIAHPDDTTPRLIFADWLEENGPDVRAERKRLLAIVERWTHTPSNRPGGTAEDGGTAGRALAEAQALEWADTAQERAKFIRVQCRIDALNAELLSHEDCGDANCPACQERRTLQAREWELLGSPDGVSGPLIVRQPRPEWAGRIRVMPWYRGDWTFRRGFIEELQTPLGLWVDRGKELISAAPLRVVRLVREPASTPEHLRRMATLLRRLAQDDEPGDNPVCRLHTLDLSRLPIDRWDINAALNKAYRPWRGLRHLILPNWANLEDRYRPYEIEQWKKRVPSLETVEFGRQAVVERYIDLTTKGSGA
jgi:uncharacterized protein (TIGR02996 family)